MLPIVHAVIQLHHLRALFTKHSMSSSAQITEIWNLTIRKYETTTKKKLDDPTLTGITTVNALTLAIEHENNTFSNFRDKGNRLREVVKHAMLPIELVGGMKYNKLLIVR